MTAPDLTQDLQPLPGAIRAWHGEISARRWETLAEDARQGGDRLLSQWGSDGAEAGGGLCVHAAYATSAGLLCVSLPLTADRSYPDLSRAFPAALRMQRAIADLLGVAAAPNLDQRPWLRHGAWSEHEFPLSREFAASSVRPRPAAEYPFVPVAGAGVHEIPVGPVHAGVIEPGHFRFQVVGERILRLEQRLGYTHKGIEKLFESMLLAAGGKLAGRISGDSTVAYAWAYAMAAESVSETAAPPRAAWLRALLLERERIANHLGDLGALGNDAGLAFGLSQFSRLKEDFLRMNDGLFGHRYVMDAVIPGGVARDLDTPGVERLHREADALEQSVTVLRKIYDDHAGLQDRFIKAGIVAPALAARLGLIGPAGRASGVAWDVRADLACPPYDELQVRIPVRTNGDVAARVIVRFEELFESIRLIRLLLAGIPAGEHRRDLGHAPEGSFGAGVVEGWRGAVMIGLHTGPQNSLRRVHAHDPSWQNWPVLEHAVAGNIVPDFPLINKSFNLSYSGHDL